MRICGNYSADGCTKTKFTGMKRKFYGGEEYVPVELRQYEREVCQRHPDACPVSKRSYNSSNILAAYKHINKGATYLKKIEYDNTIISMSKMKFGENEVCLSLLERNVSLLMDFLGTEPHMLVLLKPGMLGPAYSSTLIDYEDRLMLVYSAMNTKIEPIGLLISPEFNKIIGSRSKTSWMRNINVLDPIIVTEDDIKECEKKKITGQQMEGAMNFAKYLQNVYKEVIKDDNKKSK